MLILLANKRKRFVKNITGRTLYINNNHAITEGRILITCQLHSIKKILLKIFLLAMSMLEAG